MIGIHYKTRGQRVLGWYAIRWMNASQWIRTHMHRLPDQPRPSFPNGAPSDNVVVINNEDIDPRDEKEKLQDIVEESYKVLAEVKTVFPLTLFPDIIRIDRHKLTIIYKNFFAAEQTVSIPIEDIKNIQADHGPLFGSLTITSDNFINNTQRVNFLWNSDAMKIQKIVEGIMVATKEEVDLSAIETSELRHLLGKLGDRHKATTS